MQTRTLVAGPADLAGVVGGEERAHNELSRPHITHIVAYLLDDADVLVPHRCRPVDLLDPTVRPQVRAADAGCGNPDDRVRRRDEPRILALLHADVAGGMQDNTKHDDLLPSSSSGRPWLGEHNRRARGRNTPLGADLLSPVDQARPGRKSR
jgi:hypothetical protein